MNIEPSSELDLMEKELRDFRRQQLEKAGYGKEAADALAGRLDIDWHDAVELVRNGCSPQTALEILL